MPEIPLCAVSTRTSSYRFQSESGRLPFACALPRKGLLRRFAMLDGRLREFVGDGRSGPDSPGRPRIAYRFVPCAQSTADPLLLTAQFTA